MHRSPTPNRVGLFVAHWAVHTSLFDFLLHSESVLVTELEAEYDSAPAAVEWDEVNALTNFAVASLFALSSLGRWNRIMKRIGALSRCPTGEDCLCRRGVVTLV
jgi:hypothetical protein